MSKNFSCNNVGGKRKESDFYETPYSLTRLLLESAIYLNVPVLEPACGRGAILKVLKEYNIEAVGFDLYEGNCNKDFLNRENYRACHYPTIITNPPYSLAKEFILRAKEMVVQGVNDIYMLLPLSYLHGKQRYDEIWSDGNFPLKEVFVFTRYPMLGEPLREDGKHHTGMMVYAWFHWQKSDDEHNGYFGIEPPQIRWLDNDPYVLRKGETT